MLFESGVLFEILVSFAGFVMIHNVMQLITVVVLVIFCVFHAYCFSLFLFLVVKFILGFSGIFSFRKMDLS